MVSEVGRSCPGGLTAGGEHVPIETALDDQQGSQGENDQTDGGEGVAEVAPIPGP